MTNKKNLLTLFGEPASEDDAKCSTKPPKANFKNTAAESTAEKSNPENPDMDKAARFEALIKGEFKDIYEARIGEIIKKRLKNAALSTEALEKLRPMLDLLSAKLGIDPNDFDGLRDAFMKANAEMSRPDNAPLPDEDESEAEEALEKQAEALYLRWLKEAEDIKKDYPDFSLEAEIRNTARLSDLLRAGIDLRTCYEVLHKDDILSRNTRMVEEKLANNLLANGARPRENGISSPIGTLLRQDVSNLTKAERADIIRRVARGEIIRF